MKNKGIAKNGFYDDTNVFAWIILLYIVVTRKYNVDSIVQI